MVKALASWAEALHRPGRVLRLWRVCSDQAHGVLSSIAQYLDCVTVSDASHLHRPGFKLRFRDERKHPPYQDQNADPGGSFRFQLGV